MSSPFPCSPVIREYSLKKTQVEEKDKQNMRRVSHRNTYNEIRRQCERHYGKVIYLGLASQSHA